VTETKRKIRLRFLAHLRLNLVLGSAQRLSHGPSQKVKSPNVCMFRCISTTTTSVTCWSLQTRQSTSSSTACFGVNSVIVFTPAAVPHSWPNSDQLRHRLSSTLSTLPRPHTSTRSF